MKWRYTDSMVHKMGKNDDFSALDPQKVYCSQCFSQGTVTELTRSKTLKDRFEKPKCDHFGRFANRLQYFDGKWHSIRGLSALSVPKQIHWKCKNCGFEGVFGQPDPKCPKCGNMNRSISHKCPECGHEEHTMGGLWTCSECGWPNSVKRVHKCPQCGHEQESRSPSWTCSKCGWSNHSLFSFHHECSNCGYEQDDNVPDSTWKCPKCGKSREVTRTCPECGYTEKNTMGFSWSCPECGWSASFTHVCPECGNVETTKVQINAWVCSKCGYEGTTVRECPECAWKGPYHGVNFICPQCGWNHNKITFKHCAVCGRNAPHMNQKCMVCDGRYVWCEECQEWESVTFHADPLHRSKSFRGVAYSWMRANHDTFVAMSDAIDGHSTALKDVSGVYCWYVNNVPFYIGQSGDIWERCIDHIYHIKNDPEWWANVINDLSSLRLEILAEMPGSTAEERKAKELRLIAELRPVSQKCDGTDRVLRPEFRLTKGVSE